MMGAETACQATYLSSATLSSFLTESRFCLLFSLLCGVGAWGGRGRQGAGRRSVQARRGLVPPARALTGLLPLGQVCFSLLRKVGKKEPCKETALFLPLDIVTCAGDTVSAALTLRCEENQPAGNTKPVAPWNRNMGWVMGLALTVIHLCLRRPNVPPP